MNTCLLILEEREQNMPPYCRKKYNT
jgi:hypothetical protein